MPQKPDELHDVAAFDLGTADAQGDWVVYKDSVLFKPGSYDSHNFTMTPEEMKAAAEKVSGPIPNELEHVNTSGTSTIVDDQLGDVTDVRLSEDGSELKGTVKIPRWLDQVWDKHLAKVQGVAKQVSCVWDRRDKTLLKLGLVVKGRVPGAALMAAFSEAHPTKAAVLFAADKTWQGQSMLQSIHDTAAGCGATCRKQGEGSADFATEAELEAIQAVHDEAIKGGAVCRFIDGDMPRMFTGRKKHPHHTAGLQAVHNVVGLYPGVCAPEGSALEESTETPATEAAETAAGFGDHTTQKKAMKAIHALTVEHGADCPVKSKSVGMSQSKSPDPANTARRNPVKHEIEIRKALFADKAADAPPLTLTDEQAEAIFAVLVPVASFADNPVVIAQAKRIADLEKGREDDRKVAALKDAARFTEMLAKEGRIPPVLKPLVSGLAVQLGDDDHATPNVVTFSDAAGKSTSLARVDALLAIFAALPKKTHDVPSITDLVDDSLESRWKVQFNTGHTPAKKDGEMTPEDEDTLLASYPSGEGIVADRKKARAR